MRRLLGAVLLVSALTGCGSAPEASVPLPASSSPPSEATVAALTSPQPRPVRVSIPDRSVDGEILIDGLGVDASGGFAEPPVEQPELASWYNPGPRPGERGPSVILGHVNGNGQPGVFANLASVVEGDAVEILREDGSVAVFQVYRIQMAEKTDFPVSEVFGSTEGSELRLITCGGDLDRERRSYRSNVIVYARLTS